MVSIMPTTAEDCKALLEQIPTFRIRAMTAHVDGKPVAIGGLTYLPGGNVIAFLEGYDAVKRWPVTMHKAVRRGLEEAKARGVRRIVAIADGAVEAAPRWLERLGFQPTAQDGVYLWENVQ